MCLCEITPGVYCKRTPKNGYCWQHKKLGCKSSKQAKGKSSSKQAKGAVRKSSTKQVKGKARAVRKLKFGAKLTRLLGEAYVALPPKDGFDLKPGETAELYVGKQRVATVTGDVNNYTDVKRNPKSLHLFVSLLIEDNGDDSSAPNHIEGVLLSKRNAVSDSVTYEDDVLDVPSANLAVQGIDNADVYLDDFDLASAKKPVQITIDHQSFATYDPHFGTFTADISGISELDLIEDDDGTRINVLFE